ncbi:hypothetical protein HUG17_5900 [Dermatophagoides farinae]|uniref:Uncharacterized protein n=1 Tax=Dermatophagoides farinae TaxID=6954 RepID=A0A9D4SJ47_DERFA|nr:hypothetical protein HUG17_5900 [Dermatophagoides farinae]
MIVQLHIDPVINLAKQQAITIVQQQYHRVIFIYNIHLLLYLHNNNIIHIHINQCHKHHISILVHRFRHHTLHHIIQDLVQVVVLLVLVMVPVYQKQHFVYFKIGLVIHAVVHHHNRLIIEILFVVVLVTIFDRLPPSCIDILHMAHYHHHRLH